MPFFQRYWTVRYAAIQDWRLGYLYYGVTALIVTHLIVDILINKQYLELENVHGVILPRLKVASDMGTAHELAQSILPNNKLRLIAVDKEEELGSIPDYCLKDNGVGCVKWDPSEIATSREGEIFIATRVQQYEQISDQCRLNSGVDCRHGFRTVNRSSFYIEDVEKMVLQVEATFERLHKMGRAVDAKPIQSLNHVHLYGSLVDSGGSRLVVTKGKKDSFPLAVWLGAGGVFLHSQTDAPSSKPGLDTIRDEGAVMTVTVSYDNRESISILGLLSGAAEETTYEISINRINGSEYKTTSIVDRQMLEDGRSKRVIHKMHGVLFKFHQQGTLGYFSMDAMITRFVVGLGSLAGLSAFIDFIWSTIFPLFGVNYYAQKVYKQYKFSSSEQTAEESKSTKVE